ncbi:hypothetical protein BC832DRAFT_537064 [Gaertneriomyces semiglobifer]|nr:hypothetical protein BC832DRAFT_537064 [Gaertneriomyces semiglobifer]
MPTVLSIRPLPTYNTLLHGHYGLETCVIRGIITIQHSATLLSSKPLRVASLNVAFRGQSWCIYPTESLETAKRTHLFLYRSVDVLTEMETIPCGNKVELPFEIVFPSDPDPDALPPPPPGVNPSPHLLPPSMAFLGTSGADHPYQGHIDYEVIATLTEPPTLFAAGKVHTATATIPLKVYDPRLLPTLLHPDFRRWRSAPGAVPVEYDVEVGAIAMGPGDPLRFAYRVVVANEAARKGVRLKRISLCLREHHVVGEQRCQGTVYNPYDPIEKRGDRIKGSTELFRWEGNEILPTTTDGEFELASIQRRTSTRRRNTSSTTSDKALPRPGYLTRGGDGLYAESEITLRIPELGSFSPTTAKPPLPPPVPENSAPLPAHIEVRHTLQVAIEFIGADKLVMESVCVLSSVSQTDIAALLDTDAEVVPGLDYEKVVGKEVWVPEYSRWDAVVERVRRLGLEEWNVVRAVVCGDTGDTPDRKSEDVMKALNGMLEVGRVSESGSDSDSCESDAISDACESHEGSPPDYQVGFGLFEVT